MNKKAFTLVELIVVITILAILWTISFISLQWFSRDARDSTRISDIKSMEKILNLYKLKNNIYPAPVDPTIVTFSGATAWTQWVFWQTAYTRNSMMSNVPVDPVTALEYPYSVTADGQEYELAAVLEKIEASLITSSAYAWIQEAQIYVRWNYNGKFLKVRTGTVTYLLWIPSIIASDFTSLDGQNILLDIITNERLVYNGYKNLPASFSWSVYDTNPTDWFDFWWAPYVASDMILFAWDKNVLETDQAQRIILLDNLQASYSWTTISLEPDIIQLLAIESTSNEEASNYVANALNNSFKTTIPIVAVESIVAPDPYTNNDGTTATYLADNTNSVNRFTLSWPVWWTSTVLDNITW
jgi:prepilin-type N-terminal cleavage/methylation domain-containing protein